jgi:CRISPR-associated protein Csm4
LKLYEIIIKPLSGFGTSLKGDTLFGQFCWQAAYDSSLLNGGLEKWIDRYEDEPFAVFSTAWPKLIVNRQWRYVLNRPDIPFEKLFPACTGKDRKKRIEERKEIAQRKWLLIGEDLQISIKNIELRTNTELIYICARELSPDTKRLMRGKDKREIFTEFIQPHNTINRMTMTTGEGIFAPYTKSAVFYYPEMELALFVLINEEATDIERVCTALERIGQQGFGRDASTGLGRFELGEYDEVVLPDTRDCNACYTLAPAVPEKEAYKDYFFTPFTRFGRHGDFLATSRNPFKNPIIMADEGAVFIPNGRGIFEKPYLGRPAFHISKAQPQAVAQGYAPYLPFKLEI